MSNASFETRCICRLMKKGRLLNLVCASIVVVIVVFRFVGVGWGSVVGLFILQKVLSSFFDDFTPLIFSINQWLLGLVQVLVVAKSRKKQKRHKRCKHYYSLTTQGKGQKRNVIIARFSIHVRKSVQKKQNVNNLGTCSNAPKIVFIFSFCSAPEQ